MSKDRASAYEPGSRRRAYLEQDHERVVPSRWRHDLEQRGSDRYDSSLKSDGYRSLESTGFDFRSSRLKRGRRERTRQDWWKRSLPTFSFALPPETDSPFLEAHNYSYFRQFPDAPPSQEMDYNFSTKNVVSTWRELWIHLASAQKKAGLKINQWQIEEMQEKIEDVDFEAAEKMDCDRLEAHLSLYRRKCPSAEPIINLGASIEDIRAIADCILIKEALDLILVKLAACIENLSAFALEYKSLPTVGYVHLQPSSFVTVGKRACLWIQDLLFDLRALGRCRNDLKCSGIKGFDSNQRELLSLCDRNHPKISFIEKEFCRLSGFDGIYHLSRQSESGKQKENVVSRLSSLGASIHKMATDVEILRSLGEVRKTTVAGEEYQNKVESCLSTKSGACRDMSQHLMSLFLHVLSRSSTRWMEQSRHHLGGIGTYTTEALVTCDVLLDNLLSLISELKVESRTVEFRNREELPLLETELILVELMKRGENRVRCQKHLQNLETAIATEFRNERKSPNAVEIIKNDPLFSDLTEYFESYFDPDTRTGRAQSQVEEFVKEEVRPALEPFVHSAIFRQYGNI
ncbi:adenylosuccinate lyase-like [Centruroides vittatus]|uniref:adenylosuccinate lyase-like n=1 Tax=Centruroides vittatus TaxID=120091 RepID=UPI00350F3329